MQQFLTELKSGAYHQLWVISFYKWDNSSLVTEFERCVLTFHRAGGGVLLFGDNDPFYIHANQILRSMGVRDARHRHYVI
mgnify:CR=1 FL=1